MSTKRSSDLPAPLDRVRQRFVQWRATRTAPARIPDALWTAAVKMAGAHGIHRTAKTLRLDYYSLKQRVEQQAASEPDSPGKISAPFWELAPAAELGGAALPSGHGDCTLELEDVGGNKLRFHLRGMATPDLTALSRSFWNPTS